mgnify:CR=1 FL=1
MAASLDRLLAAAEDIARLRNRQKERTAAWLQLAADARKPGADRRRIEQRKRELETTVVDFSDAIEDPCAIQHIMAAATLEHIVPGAAHQ